MTSNPTHASNKTLQIALVGVRPADQVMLKGYMRVILRLETGLEWVSANHPSVDFYIVNYEFAQADSVKKLLAAQPNAAVLYVQRDEGNGGMVDNVLTLPLKELDQLKYWLGSHIDSVNEVHHSTATHHIDEHELTELVSPAPTARSILPTKAQPATQARMTLDEIIASRAKNPAATQPNPVTSAHPPSQASQVSTASGESLLALLRQFHATGDKLFSLTKDGELVAYVHPGRQKIWRVKDIAVFTPDLNVVANNHEPTLDNYPAEDLVQWLWEKTFDMPLTSLQQLAKDNVTYHITSWVKPDDSQPSHDILKIQCVLEAREVTLAQLLQLSNVSQDTCLRAVAALVASGLMSSHVYFQLKDIPTIDTVLDTVPVNTNVTPSASSPVIPTIATNTPNPAIPTNDKPADDGMKGFLSKLRRKLGL